MRLDALDARLVALLREDARLSFREMARRTGSTTPTVSARVKALEEIGLVRGYHAQLDAAALGGATYVITLTVQPALAKDAFAALQRAPGIRRVHLLPGRLVAFAHVRPPMGLASLHEALATMPGALTLDVHEVLDTHESNEPEEVPDSVNVPCHECQGPIQGDPVRATLGGRAHVFCCRHCLGAFRERYEKRLARVPVRGGHAGPPR